MSEINNGGPAFPNGDDVTLGRYAPHPGMSLRDYFAAKAMPGLMQRNWSEFKGTDNELIATWAKSSYAIADAMLAEREKQK